MTNLNEDKLLDKINSNISELTINLSEMFESLQIISRPIKESTENMPLATDHLTKITKQTELATNQILDKLDAMTERDSEALKIIVGEIEKLGDSKTGDTIKKTLVKLENAFSSDLNDSYEIMESLQFQDITSQRIGFITTLLDGVEYKLNNLLNALGEVTKLKKIDAKDYFDPTAEYTDSKDRQSLVDKVIEEKDSVDNKCM